MHIRRARLQNALIAVLSVLLVLGLAWQSAAPPVLAQSGALEVTNSPLTINPGVSGNVNFTLRNNSGIDRTFSLNASGGAAGFTSSFPNGTTVVVPNGGTSTFSVQIAVAPTVIAGTQATFRLESISNNQPSLTFSTSFTVIAGGSTPTATTTATTTQTPTITPSRTSTTGPTATRGPVCQDGFEDNDDRGQAKTIDVNTTQEHTMCPAGDEDWLVFGGVRGKVYTIDITRMDAGLDLSLEVFDDKGQRIAFNDDYYNRDPANPNPGDVRPRIQSLAIPYDGPYYIRVRDAAGRGSVNYFYVIALIAESHGPTPTNVVEVCLDMFEPDGLPEQARLITSNELQEDRRLCPKGDADWVTFFAKAGKRYVFFTDTRRYRGENQVNRDTQAGADTTIVLTDRDGVSLLDANDDIPGANTLDSQIEFTPLVDGFYFIQVKNIGDIGNQFIRYDVTLLLCLPGQTDCGRVTQTPGRTEPQNPVTPNPTAPVGTPTAEFDLDRTATPVLTATPTATRVP